MKILLSALLAACYFLVPINASAVTVSALTGGLSLSGGGFLFDNWSIHERPPGTPHNDIQGDITPRTEFDLSNIDVTIDTSNPLDTKLTFTSLANELQIEQAAPGLNGDARLHILFDVTTDPGVLWHDHSIVAYYTEVIIGGGADDHSVHAHSELYTDDTLSLEFDSVDTHLIRDGLTFTDESGVVDHTVFAGRTSGTVKGELSWLTDSAGEGVGITSYTLGFSIPEPSAALLSVFGLSCLMLRRRR